MKTLIISISSLVAAGLFATAVSALPNDCPETSVNSIVVTGAPSQGVLVKVLRINDRASPNKLICVKDGRAFCIHSQRAASNWPLGKNSLTFRVCGTNNLGHIVCGPRTTQSFTLSKYNGMVVSTPENMTLDLSQAVQAYQGPLQGCLPSSTPVMLDYSK